MALWGSGVRIPSAPPSFSLYSRSGRRGTPRLKQNQNSLYHIFFVRNFTTPLLWSNGLHHRTPSLTFNRMKYILRTFLILSTTCLPLLVKADAAPETDSA